MTAITVARGTILESLRDRVLYLPVIFVIFILMGSLFLGTLSLGEMERVVVDFGLVGITFFSLLTAVFLGIGWSYQGITRRTAYVLLARPVHRRSVLWGAYLGLGTLQLMSLVLMAVSWWLILSLVGISWTGAMAVSMGLLYVGVLLVTALALFLSTIASPAVAGASSVVLILVGYSSRDLRDLACSFPDSLLRALSELVYYLVPCLSNFSLGELGYSPEGLLWGEVIWAVAYGLSYALALLMISGAIFSRRELP